MLGLILFDYGLDQFEGRDGPVEGGLIACTNHPIGEIPVRTDQVALGSTLH